MPSFSRVGTCYAVDAEGGGGHGSAIIRKISANRPPWNGHRRQVEGDLTAMADNLRADFYQLLLERRHRPMLDRLGRRQGLQKIAEIIGERVKLFYCCHAGLFSGRL
jgi:hypothetical protein